MAKARHYWRPPDGKVKVAFRTYPDGDVIAMFPEIPEDRWGDECLSYMTVGQHGGANCRGVIDATRPATPREYAAIKRELEGIGYNLDVRQRITRAMTEERRAQV